MVTSTSPFSVRPTARAESVPAGPDLMKTFLLAYESVIEMLRPSMKAAALTEPQWRVLHELKARSPMIASELAANTFVRASSLSRILRDLEARDLISRAQQFEDLRKTLVTLTDYGLRTIEPIETVYVELIAQVTAGIGADAVGACTAACERIVGQIGAEFTDA